MSDSQAGRQSAGGGSRGGALSRSAYPGPGIRELLNGIFYSYKLILVTFFAPIALAAAFSTTLKVNYPADAQLLVLLSRQHILGAGLGTAGFGGALNMQARIVKAEAQILGARELREEVARTFGPLKLYPDLQDDSSLRDEASQILAAATELDNDLTVDLSSTSDIVHLHFEHHNPVLAADVLNYIIDRYLIRRQSIFADEGNVVMESRIHELEDELAALTTQIEDLQRDIDVSDFEIARRAALQKLAKLEEARFTAQAAVQGLSARLKELELLIGLVPEEVPQFSDDGESTALNSAMDRLNSLEVERSKIANIYKPNSKIYQEIEIRVAQARQSVETVKQSNIGRQRVGRNATHDSLTREMIVLQAQQREQEAIFDEQEKAIEETQQRLLDLESVQSKHNKLFLDRTILIEKLKEYSVRLEKENLAKSLENLHDDPTIRIIERAVPAVEGKSRHLQVISIGILCGIIFSVAAIYLTSIGRSIMITPEEAQRTLELPVLLSIATKD